MLGRRVGIPVDCRVRWATTIAAGVAALSATLLAIPASAHSNPSAGTSTYIVAAPSSSTATALGAVAGVGGTQGPSLPLISGTTAQLSAQQVAALRAMPNLIVTPDVTVKMQGEPGSGGWHGSDGWQGPGSPVPASSTPRAPAAVFPQQTEADKLWAQGDTGRGVNVALLDTGIQALPDFSGRLVDGVDLSGEGNPFQDNYGHGTFVAGLIAGNGTSSGGQYMGEAPGAGLVSVKVAGASGNTTMAEVIEGIEWTVDHRSTDSIKVLNLSLGYRPVESTAVDPLDQAVEKAWAAGITVVVSAGDAGPDNGTILSPGNDPSVITVGALDDGGQTNPANDTMTTFSSVGPTSPDGWFKPDLVTSGRSVVSLRDAGSTVDTDFPSARIGNANFVGSGTSFSSAVVSGAVALLLADHPSDPPDTVKGTLLGTTSPGPVGNAFVDGHGSLDIAAAAASTPMTLTQVPGQSGQGTLAYSWSTSSWNLDNWQGHVWNGHVWNGHVWNGHVWNGHVWNGSVWNGSVWNGSVWNGSVWNGHVWNGSVWNGSVWNGVAWDGSLWNGSVWNGSVWNGSVWNGSVWNGSIWN